MLKWTAALLGVVVAGVVGGLTMAHTGAQEATLRHQDPPEVEAVLPPVRQQDPIGRLLPQSDLYDTDVALTQALQVQHLQAFGQAGTWQIVNAKDLVLLLNSTSGATFMLVHKDGDAHWKAVEGQFPATTTAVRSPALRRSVEGPDSGRRIPLPPDMDRPARAEKQAGVVKDLEETLRSIDQLIRNYEARLKKDVEGDARKELEDSVAKLRAEREKVAKELEEARAEARAKPDSVPRGR